MGVMDTAMVMDSATTDTDTATTARGLLRLSPRLRPRLWLIPTTATATVSDTAMDTTATDMDMAMALDTTDVATMVATMARGLLMLSPRLRPRLWLIPITATATVLDTPDTAMDTTATDMALAMDTTDVATMVATTARGLLMLSPRPRLMLIPTTAMAMADTTVVWATTAVDTMAMDTVSMDTVMATAMATTDKPSLQHLLLAQPPHHYSLGDLVTHQDLSVNHHQLPCQRQMGHFSLSFVPHQCCQFQCHQTSVASNGEQEAYENQNVIIRQIKNEKL